MSADDDELLKQLGRAVRAAERGADAPRLERLSYGALPQDELAALKTRAAQDAELDSALEAHAPLGAEVKERISSHLVAVATERRTAEELEVTVRTRSNVVDLRTRARRGLWIALPLSAAAAALLWVAGAKQVAPIPGYDLQLSGAQADVRSGPVTIDVSDPPPVVRIARDARVRLLLRPATAVAGAVAARVYVEHGGALVEWPAHAQNADSGALQLLLAAPPRALAGAEAVVVVGRPELLAARAEALARGAQAQGPGFQRWRLRLELGTGD